MAARWLFAAAAEEVRWHCRVPLWRLLAVAAEVMRLEADQLFPPRR